MKASLKFREDQKPLITAKVPVNIRGLPFLSGASAGDHEELCLSFSTFFESGPSFKLFYRPNDAWNSVSLAVKSGIGSFGSPISSPFAMSAEFNLLGRANPTFFLHFKPKCGDFSIKRMTRSTIARPSEPSVFGRRAKAAETDADMDSVDGGEMPDGESRQGGGSPPNDSFVGALVNGLFSGTEVNTTSILPLRSCTALKFRWGVRFPSTISGNGSWVPPTAQLSLRKIPLLMMSKVSVEHVVDREKLPSPARAQAGQLLHGHDDVAGACFSVQRQLDTLQADNGLLLKAIKELRSGISAGKIVPMSARSDSCKSEGHGETSTETSGNPPNSAGTPDTSLRPI